MLGSVTVGKGIDAAGDLTITGTAASDLNIKGTGLRAEDDLIIKSGTSVTAQNSGVEGSGVSANTIDVQNGRLTAEGGSQAGVAINTSAAENPVQVGDTVYESWEAFNDAYPTNKTGGPVTLSTLDGGGGSDGSDSRGRRPLARFTVGQSTFLLNGKTFPATLTPTTDKNGNVQFAAEDIFMILPWMIYGRDFEKTWMDTSGLSEGWEMWLRKLLRAIMEKSDDLGRAMTIGLADLLNPGMANWLQSRGIELEYDNKTQTLTFYEVPAASRPRGDMQAVKVQEVQRRLPSTMEYARQQHPDA